MKDCKDCIILDPKSNKPYLRASRISEARRQPEKALKFLEHAIEVTPPSQVDPFRKRRSALQKLVESLQPEIPRVDPITVLPEELLAAIMEIASDQDPRMPARFSWVSRTWREMTINCPFLWRQVRLDGARHNQVLKRLHIHGQRGHGKLDKIRVEPIPENYEPLVNAVRPFLPRVKSLSIHGDNAQSFSGFIGALRHTCHHLEELVVVLEGHPPGELRLPSQIHLGLVAPSMTSALRTVKVYGHHFAGSHEPVPVETFDRLESIMLDHCVVFADSFRPDEVDDVIHRTLRSAKNVKRLELRSSLYLARLAKGYSDTPIQLDKLETLAVPDSLQYTLDTATPNLKRLSMAKAVGNTSFMEEAHLVRDPRRGLLPSLRQLAPTKIPVSELSNLAIAVNDNDKAAALKSWLMRLNEVVELAVISETDCREDGANWGTDVHLVQPMLDAANNKIVSVLHGRPEWCPRMHSLRLERCLVPPREMMEYVKARKTSPTLATIRTLILDNCSIMPPEAELWLQRNVENFRVTKAKPAPPTWRDRQR